MFLFLNILKNLALLIVLLFQVNYGAPEYVKRKVNAFDAPYIVRDGVLHLIVT